MSETTIAVPLRWMTTEQVGEYLKLSPRTLERMRRDGTGPRFERLGHKTIRYHIEEVDAWVGRRGGNQ